MEFIWTLISGIFIAIVIGTALAFGFAMLVWIMVLGIVITVAIYFREIYGRWRFIRDNDRPRRPESPKVIEGEYKDLTD